MKRFRFAQQQLLNVREQQHRLLEARIAQALMERNKARTELQAAEQELEKISNGIMNTEHGDVVQTYLSVPAARRRILLAQQNLLEKEMSLAHAREELREMKVAVESLDTLRLLRRQEHLKQQQYEQQKEVEFTVLRRWTKDRAALGKEVGDD